MTCDKYYSQYEMKGIYYWVHENIEASICSGQIRSKGFIRRERYDVLEMNASASKSNGI